MTLKQGSGSNARLEDDDDMDPLDDEDGDRMSKKRKMSGAGSSSGTGAMVPVEIQLEKAVALTFSVQYLVNFTKAAPLASAVTLHMADKVPLLVEFAFENGHVRYYLAPKLAEVCHAPRVCRWPIQTDDDWTFWQSPNPTLPIEVVVDQTLYIYICLSLVAWEIRYKLMKSDATKGKRIVSWQRG